MRPYPSQPIPPNWHTPFDQGDLIPRTGSSTNPKPTYMFLPSRTSWSSTPSSTYSSSASQKLSIPNHVVFATNSGRTKPRVHILAKTIAYTKPHGHTQPINCNLLRKKDTMTPYIVQARHL